MRVSAVMIEPVGGHGGMDYYDFSLCEGIRASDADVVLYTSDETVIAPGLSFPVRRVFRKIYGTSLKPVRALRFLTGLLKALTTGRKENSPIVHFHLFHFSLLEWICIFLADAMGFFIVLTIHDAESFVGADSDRIRHYILHKSTKIIVHNQVSHQAVQAYTPGNKIRIIPHGHYIEKVMQIPKTDARRQLGLDENKIILLFFGQIKKVKGLDILLNSLRDVIENYPQVQLVIAGKVWKDDFLEYENIIRQNRLHTYVRRDIQYIPNEEVHRYFSAADLVVLPYRKIYQSGVLLTALSYGKPVLTSDIPGMTEIIKDGETGFTFKNGDHRDLSGKIIRIFASAEKMEAVGREGTARIRNDHSWSLIGAETVELYKEILIEGRFDG